MPTPSAEGDALKIMSGGRALKTPFGTFHVPIFRRTSMPASVAGRWRSLAMP